MNKPVKHVFHVEAAPSVLYLLFYQIYRHLQLPQYHPSYSIKTHQKLRSWFSWSIENNKFPTLPRFLLGKTFASSGEYLRFLLNTQSHIGTYQQFPANARGWNNANHKFSVGQGTTPFWENNMKNLRIFWYCIRICPNYPSVLCIMKISFLLRSKCPI